MEKALTAKERSLRNLRPWKPGQSGNPKGRPARLPVTESHLRLASQPLPEELRKALKLRRSATWADAYAATASREALKGNMRALAEITDRIEGKATQRVELGGLPESNGEIIVHVVYDREPKR